MKIAFHAEDSPNVNPNAGQFDWQVANPFVAEVRVAEGHLDEFNHTNNVVYLYWMQELATLHSQACGLTFDDYRRMGTGCVARRHEINYVLPTFKDDLLYLATWIESNEGRSDMWRGYQFIRASDKKTIAHGRTQWVCVDMATGRPKRQPQEFLAAYAVGGPPVRNRT